MIEQVKTARVSHRIFLVGVGKMMCAKPCPLGGGGGDGGMLPQEIYML